MGCLGRLGCQETWLSCQILLASSRAELSFGRSEGSGAHCHCDSEAGMSRASPRYSETKHTTSKVESSPNASQTHHLPGDGIGPEVTDEAVRVLENIADVFHHQLSVTRKDVGGAALVSARTLFRAIPCKLACRPTPCCWVPLGDRHSIAFPAICAQKVACCGFAASWEPLPICAPPFVSLRLRIVLRFAPRRCGEWT